MAQGVHWKDQGASLTLTFQDLKITRVSDNKSITINGTHTYTNVTGGLLINLLILGTVTHSITSSNMSITFDDNTQRTWQVAKQRVYTFSGNNVSVTTIRNTYGRECYQYCRMGYKSSWTCIFQFNCPTCSDKIMIVISGW